MRLRDLHAEWRESPAFLLGAHFFGIVKGEQPLTRCGESGVQRLGGGSRNTPPCLWPARSAKPFDQKKKPAPRHQRENQLKEKTSSVSGPRGAQSHLTEKENPPRAIGARRSLEIKKTSAFRRAEVFLFIQGSLLRWNL